MSSRRQFLKQSALLAGSVSLAGMIPNSLEARNKLKSFGFQTWTIREALAKNPEGTLKSMAAMGYKEVEFCSPLGYSGTGFEVFNTMGGKDLRKLIESAGLVCQSSHFNMGELRANLDNRIEWAKQMGLTQMICSSFWLPENASMDDYRKSCDELNQIGKKIKAAGMQTGFHNHHMEFQKINDQLIYDVLMETFDPEIIKMQFQVAVISIGYKASDYFRKYPGRFVSAHLADWSAEKNANVPIGSGVVNWNELFEAAKTGGVQNYFVEMDPETFAPSAEYLKKI